MRESLLARASASDLLPLISPGGNATAPGSHAYIAFVALPNREEFTNGIQVASKAGIVAYSNSYNTKRIRLGLGMQTIGDGIVNSVIARERFGWDLLNNLHH